MTHERLDHILAQIPNATIAVIGDFFLDKYLILDPALSEPSIETGLEAYQIVDKRPSPGAAGTVCSNLAGLEAGTILAVGAIGDDGDGYELRQGLRCIGVDHTHLVTLPDRFTPTYTKPMMLDVNAPGGERETNRMDVKWREETTAATEDQVLDQLDACMPRVDGIIISDQVQERGRGVITDRVREAIQERAVANPQVHVLADSRTRIDEYRHVMVKPNALEAGASAGDMASLQVAARKLANRNGKPAYITWGQEGLLVAEESGSHHVPGIRVPGEIDIVGAGDSTAAGIVAALCAGATPVEAGQVGNLVASITIQQIGTTGKASLEQLRNRHLEL